MNAISTTAKKLLLARQLALRGFVKEIGREQDDLLGTREPDPLDAAEELGEARTLERLSQREREELREVEHALHRIDDGTYGRCERCDRAIGRQRLLAVPEARYCISCGAGFAEAGESPA